MVDRIVLGDVGAGGAYGLRVSKPGVDVFTGNPAELSFDSLSPNTRILQTGSCATTYDSGSARTFVNNVVVQLPNIDYEPIVFMSFIGIISNTFTLDPMRNQRHTTLWFSGEALANPKDYAQYVWNPTTKQLTFSARCVRMNSPWTTNTLWEFRYIVFSNKAD